jgi:hypothetical protein
MATSDRVANASMLHDLPKAHELWAAPYVYFACAASDFIGSGRSDRLAAGRGTVLRHSRRSTTREERGNNR